MNSYEVDHGGRNNTGHIGNHPLSINGYPYVFTVFAVGSFYPIRPGNKAMFFEPLPIMLRTKLMNQVRSILSFHPLGTPSTNKWLRRGLFLLFTALLPCSIPGLQGTTTTSCSTHNRVWGLAFCYDWKAFRKALSLQLLYITWTGWVQDTNWHILSFHLADFIE